MISIGFLTSRLKPRFEWFFDSLRRQIGGIGNFEVVVIDHFAEACDDWGNVDVQKRRDELFVAAGDLWAHTSHHPPKPSVFSGPHRLTKSWWWSKSNSANTFLCRARGEFLTSVDDRSVLAPGWLDSVRAAMEGNYAVCGAYEKFHHMVVENGVMSSGVEPVDEFGRKTGKDHRITGHLPRARHCIPGWFFGCSFALPTEWALQVNGWNELLDGLSAEDTHFGHMLANNGFDIRFDPRMKVLQDRTPGECGPEMKRDSKERFQHDTQDKGHEAIRRFFGEKMSSHHWNIREIRDKVLAGGNWPTLENAPTHDWFDQKAIAEFE